MIGQLSSLRIPRLALSLSLVFWVSGAGCLIGCENMVKAAVNEAAVSPRGGATVVAGKSCAHAADHSCCAKHRATSLRQSTGRASKPALQLTTQTNQAVLLPLSDGTMNMCPLAMNAAALATTARADDSMSTVTLSPVELSVADTGQTAAASSLRPSRFSNRGHTYLRYCVFLI